ncbi:MAG TPA: DUF4962 domain-containing protein [Candidatus Brocadiia bacterium]|nr:DUF4962 domain-containing protein [Candidatus Brocadiia bacterium]
MSVNVNTKFTLAVRRQSRARGSVGAGFKPAPTSGWHINAPFTDRIPLAVLLPAAIAAAIAYGCRSAGTLAEPSSEATGQLRADAQTLPLDEGEGRTGEWGFRPAQDEKSPLNPPAFVWRPQKDAVFYTFQLSRDPSFEKVGYSIAKLDLYCHTPDRTLESGRWFWRFNFRDANGADSQWSKPRSFTVPDDARPFPMPAREELLRRIPSEHPRLFIRPEQLPELRNAVKGRLKPVYDSLAEQSEKIIAKPPDVSEPPLYPQGTIPKSEEWKAIWWGNRLRTIAVLNGAATLGFTWQIDGNEEFGRAGKELLLAAAKWDPRGATGYRYNDEAGMPGAYYMARAYTFLHPLLSEEERALVRTSLTARGREMYAHLYPKHIWTPYASHSNRAWHFLGEVGIALHGELPEADDWVWFAMNVFYHAYPVWCDDDGGWHEGMAYWRSYIERFSWWADIMRIAFGVNAFDKPYFSKIGYYPIYVTPPGTLTGGFGDLAWDKRSEHQAPLMSILAAQSGNPHWQWYVDATGGAQPENAYWNCLLDLPGKIEGKPPADIPSSRLFRGIGLAVLNTTILDGSKNIQVQLKSSPFGSDSHGYDSQNAFLMNVCGERLFISSGQRDVYGSDHHRNWMWRTRSVNSIEVNGIGQGARDMRARGKITAFFTSEGVDYTAGEAAEAYGDVLKGFRRHILFVKPHMVVILDQLEAPKPSLFTWLLHCPSKMTAKSQHEVLAAHGVAAGVVDFISPEGLKMAQTDKFDPPPRPHIKLIQYHLTAETIQRAESCRFLTVIRPYRSDSSRPEPVRTERTGPGEWELRVKFEGRDVAVKVSENADGCPFVVEEKRADGEVQVLFSKDDGGRASGARN